MWMVLESEINKPIPCLHPPQALRPADYALVLGACRRLAAPDLAIGVFRALVEQSTDHTGPGGGPTQSCVDSLMLALAQAHLHRGVLALFQTSTAAASAKPSLVQLETALDSCGHLGEVDTAVRVLEQASAGGFQLSLDAYHGALRALAVGLEPGDPRWKYAEPLVDQLPRRGGLQATLETRMLRQRVLGRSGDVNTIVEGLIRIREEAKGGLSLGKVLWQCDRSGVADARSGFRCCVHQFGVVFVTIVRRPVFCSWFQASFR